MMVPGSGAGRCRPCLNRHRIERDAAVQVLALERDWAREAYGAFGRWLLAENASAPKLSQTFVRHFAFFERLSAALETASALEGDGLLAHFSVVELRRHALPVRFLAGYAGVALDESAKQAQVERGRIAEKLLVTRREPYGPMLRRYVEWLNHLGTPPRTQRLYLAAAAQLCQVERLSPEQPCQSMHLENFLRGRPGLRASLFRWATFGNQVLGWSLKMPPLAARTRHPPRALRELSVLKQQIDAAGANTAPVALLQRAIAKTLGFKLREMAPARWALREDEDKLYLISSAESVQIPEPMRQWVIVWKRRTAGASRGGELLPG